jgi:leucyl-tRNA synthetase
MVAGTDEQDSLLADTPADEQIEQALHKLIKKVGEDIEAMKFNTAIAAMMEFVNQVFKTGQISRDQAGRFVQILAPFAPHIAEQLWQQLGHDESLACAPWPEYDEQQLAAETVEMVVQVNGKVRGRIEVSPQAGQEEAIQAARADAQIAENLEGKTVVKEIVVPGRLVNFVVKG